MSTSLTSQPYLDRRRRLMRECGEGLILVRGGGPSGLNPNFYYLTGIAEARAALVLSAEGLRVGTGRMHPGRNYVHGRTVKQVLFLPPRNPLAARWGEDSAATAEAVQADAVGFDEVFGSPSMEEMLGAALQNATALHYVRGSMPVLFGADDADTELTARVARRYLGVRVLDATPIVHEMRRSKDAVEIEIIERAVAITAEAVDRAMRSVRPGMREYEVEAEIARAYRAHGAEHAFDPIVACGANALSLHYTENRGSIEQGQLLLIDTGASIDGYKGDITRTIPVDGRFSPRQHEVYRVVLEAQQAAIAACRPGALLGDLHATAFDVIERAGFGEYLPHGLGHSIGLETHDVGDLHRPLQAGAVITVEPGIYIPDEKIGIRIEDDVLITDAGHRVLSENIPKQPEALEALVGK